MSGKLAAHGVDPVTLEVLRHRLDCIAEEMETTLLKSSCSPIVKEGLDASASLFTLDGVTLAQACAIPIHLGTLIPAVAEIIRTFPVATMQAGDVYLLNDPYCGGTHLPDFAVVTPVFAAQRPIALAAAMTHHQDVGGKTAGSVPTEYRTHVRLAPGDVLDLVDGDGNSLFRDNPKDLRKALNVTSGPTPSSGLKRPRSSSAWRRAASADHTRTGRGVCIPKTCLASNRNCGAQSRTEKGSSNIE